MSDLSTSTDSPSVSLPALPSAQVASNQLASEEIQRRRDAHVRLATIIVIGLISLYAEAALATATVFLVRRAQDNASLSTLDREYGTWKNFPRIIRDRAVVETALTTIPEDAAYRVLIGSRWDPALRTRWTSSLERDFIRFYLMPRRLTDSAQSQWVLCLACSPRVLGRDVRVLARGRDGMLLLRVDQ
jgi:hypothetical protein